VTATNCSRAAHRRLEIDHAQRTAIVEASAKVIDQGKQISSHVLEAAAAESSLRTVGS